MYKVNTIETNGKAVETLRHMRGMVECYYQDMAPYAYMDLHEVFSRISRIPFREDPLEEETLMRPIYTMNSQGWGGDCDDKCIALASWARLHKIPYRFVAVRRPDMPVLHHVFCELYIGDRWLHADPTYSFNVLGREREYYAERVYA